MKPSIEIRSEFRLRRLVLAKDPDFVEAVRIYAEVTPPALRDSTNYLAYWIGRYDRVFRGDHLMFFSFYFDNKVVGFSLATYLSSAKLLIIDHIAIAADYRKNDAFFVLAEQIRGYVRHLNLDIMYVATEIDAYGEDAQRPSEGQLLVRLAKLLGFRVAKALYYQPSLGDQNPTSERRTVLMIRPYAHTNTSELSKAEYLNIVHCLYFDHYVRWYADVLEDPKSYEARVKQLYDQVEASLKRNAPVELNGHHADGILGGHAPTAKTPTELLRFIFPGVLVILLTAGMISSLILVAGLDWLTTASLVLLSLFVVVIVASLVSPSARDSVEAILRALKAFSGKDK